ncbi:MAG: protein kinase [Acidobacteriota bacterium]
MSTPIQLRDRYELRQVLGRGGMGVVYSAYDSRMKREVALKTVLDIDNQAALDLFFKEWGILAAMVHPNIVEIYDIGEFEQEGRKHPFFVMPLLPGVSLDKLIKQGSPRLTVDRVVDIINQACRGLQAAHEMGLVHRDVKPSNIFVMDDDAVKLIDFGIARTMSDTHTSLKGTLSYISPEQIQMKPPSAFSDQYALGVVTYEALTRRIPFRGASDAEVIDAILNQSIPSITELNPKVNFTVSQVVHKTLAKQPWHRFANIKEFGETLQKAARQEVLEQFDNAKVKPRLQRAVERYEQGDYEFALELITELESEGHLDQEIQLVKRQVGQAVRKTRIRALLDNARRFFDAQEYSLALRKIQEALELDSGDPDSLALKSVIEKERREKKIDEWIQIARQHLENQAYQQSREALDNVLKLKPDQTSALHLAAELNRRTEEMERIRGEKSELYNSAMQAWDRGEVTSAFSRLELLGALEKNHPDPDKARSSGYQSFYNQVRSEHDLQRNRYEEARKLLADEKFEQAASICKQSLTKYPNHALFQALQYDVEDRRRQKLSAVIAETDRRAEAEPDLDRRAALLESIAQQYPGVGHFERALQSVHDKRDLVNSIVAKARYFEEQQQLTEALDQWRILNSIHEAYPGLSYELERLEKRRDQQARENSKSKWIIEIDRLMQSGDHDRAVQATADALAEFPGDAELGELGKLAKKTQERGRQAQELLARAREASESERADEGLALLREAYQTDPKSSIIRTVLLNGLVERAGNLIGTDHETAEPLLREVLELDPEQASAKSLLSQVADRKREASVSASLAEARRLQAEGDLEAALAIAKQGILDWPNETRFQQLSGALERNIADLAQHPVSTIRDAQAVSQLLSGIAAAKPIAVATDSPAVPSPAKMETQPLPSVPVSTPIAPEPAAAPTPGRLTAPRGLPLIAWLAAAAVALAGVGFLAFRPHQPEPPFHFKAVFQSSPAGATLRVNGTVCGVSSCEMDLASGAYRVEAALDGYTSGTTTVEISRGGVNPAAPVVLTLTPPVVADAAPVVEPLVAPPEDKSTTPPPEKAKDKDKKASDKAGDSKDIQSSVKTAKTQGKRDGKAGTRLVGVHDGTPFDVALVTPISANAAQGTPLRFVATRDLVVDGAIVIAKGATVTGELAHARRRLFGGGKMTFRLTMVEAVDAHKYTVRALAIRTDNGERPVETAVKPTDADLAAPAGTLYVAYIQDDAIVTVPK